MRCWGGESADPALEVRNAMSAHATYLILLLVWLAPVLAIQWHAGARILRARWRVVALATLLPTAYLAAADHYALRAGIWQISAERATGIALAGLPLEELLFFLLTNLVVVQAVMLFLAPDLTPAFARRQLAWHLRALHSASRPARWYAGLLASGVALLVATSLAVLSGSALPFDWPPALIPGLAPGADAAWQPDSAGHYFRPLSLVAAYLALGTLAGWLARGGCLIARTLTVLVGLGSCWLYGEFVSLPVAVILAGGPLLPGLLRQALGRRSGSRLPGLANEHLPC